nr:helix-turn-helix domain-containing protein [Amycolatopsis arida]
MAALATGRTTTDLAELLGIAPSSASEHAHVLRNCWLVVSQRIGQHVLHSLTPLGHALRTRQL